MPASLSPSSSSASISTASPSLAELSDDDSSLVSNQSEVSISSFVSNPLPPLQRRSEPLRRPATRSSLLPVWRDFFSTAFTTRSTEAPLQDPSADPLPPDHSLPPPLQPPLNLPSGDHFGQPTPDSFRIWSNNVNGLSSANGFATLHELCGNLLHHKVNAIALQETNLDFTQQWIRDAVSDILREHFGNARLITATSCIPAPASWKPGGVALAILGPWADAVTRTESDDLGRWCTATFAGANNTSFTIYSAYNVVKATLDKVGTATVFAQQWRLLRLAGVQQPDPRRQFITDLLADLQRRRRNDEHVLLIGDFNEQIGDDPKLMASVCSALNLFDPHTLRHGDAVDIPTYIRGKKRLDYCFLDSIFQPSIAACGINLFNDVFHSDHRALFLDLRLKTFLRTTLPPLPQPHNRFIGTRSPALITFVETAHRHMENNNAFAQYDDFCDTVATLPSPWIQANKIDDVIGHAFSVGERKCYRRQRPPWSEKLFLASAKVRYWKIALTARRTGTNHQIVLDDLASQLWPSESAPPHPQNLRALKSVGRAAERALQRVRRVALEERRSFLDQLRERIALRTKTSDTSPEAALKNVTRQLQDNKQFKRIRRALNPLRQPPLTEVEIIHESAHLHPVTGARVAHRNVQKVDVRKELEASIIARNKRHFAQADGTPYTRPPLSLISSRNKFNLYEDEQGQPIEVPADCFVETHTIMDILREHAASPPPSWSPELDFDAFISAFLHWNESTSTSPSRRHLGLYKALVTTYINASGEFNIRPKHPPPLFQTPQDKAEQILRLIHGLASHATAYGFFLHRWIHVINVMIYKKAGCIELDRLRVIHLFEADFNLCIGVLFGRRAMQHSVSHSLLHHGQFGKPGGECQDAALSKVLHNLLAFFTKTAFGQFESDATACFDRVVMAFSLVTFSVLGAPPGPLTMWEQALLNIVHRVKTAHGITDASYCYSPASPIIGPGQGSRGGPAACSTATSPLLEAMDRLGHGVHFCDPAQHLQYLSTVNMFIDDASNASNAFLSWLHTPPRDFEVVELLRHDAQTWERCLWTSGGLLNLAKCLYYVALWKFDNEGEATLTPATDIHPPLALTSGDDPSLTPVHHYNYDKAHRYLGDWLAINLQMTTAQSKLAASASQYTRRLSCSPLSKRDTWIAYFACFIPGITYTFSVTHHSSKKLRRLQSPPTRATLMKLGFNRNTAHAVVYGPSRYGALGLRDWPVEQGISQLTMFIRHLRGTTQQGRLLLISLAWWQLYTGTSYQLLQDPHPPVQFSDTNLFTVLRAFLKDINGSFYIAALASMLPSPNRVGDLCIMDVVSSLPNVTTRDRDRFNRCRLFHGVAFLSEIASADGSALARDAWDGTRLRHSPLLWPYQPQPGPRSYRVWRRLLAVAFLQGHRKWTGISLKDLQLRSALRDWLPNTAWLRSRWSTFFSSTSDSALRRQLDGTYTMHPLIRLRKRPVYPVRGFTAQSTLTIPTLPSDAVPIDITPASNHFVTTVRLCRLQPSVAPLPPPSTWHDYVSSLPEWARVLLVDTIFLVPIDDVLQILLSSSSLCLASDGGAKPLRGSFGCLLATHDTILVTAGGRAFGADPQSFRSEAYGMLAALLTYFHLHTYFQIPITMTSLDHYTDSESLLKRLQTSRTLLYPYPRRHLYSEADVELQILSVLSNISAPVAIHHVFSHEDDHTELADLPWPNQLNYHCDIIATTFLRAAQHALPTVPFLPASACSLQVGSVTLTHHIPTQLRTLARLPAYQIFLQRHHHWPNVAVFDIIDWGPFHKSTLKLSFLKRLFVIKWVNDLLPFQQQQYDYSQSPTPTCPSACGASSETAYHFLRCPHFARVALWQTFSVTLHHFLDRHHLDPALRRMLLYLLSPFTQLTAPPIDDLGPEYHQLLSQQKLVGSNSLLFGYLVKDWIVLQHRYLTARSLPSSRNQATNAICQLMLQFHTFTHELWLIRNSHLHGTTLCGNIPYKHLHLVAQITELYDARPHMLQSDRDLVLSTPLDVVTAMPTNALKMFYYYTKPLVERSLKQAAAFGPSFRRMHDYFPLRIPPELHNVICLDVQDPRTTNSPSLSTPPSSSSSSSTPFL